MFPLCSVVPHDTSVNVAWISLVLVPIQDLVEKVVVLRRAVEQAQRSGPAGIGILLAEKMSQYASLLASQGSLCTAIAYLPDNTNQVWDTWGRYNLTINCYWQISVH